MRIRLASLALVLGLLAVPALALAGALACSPCCASAAAAPCEPGAEPCAELSPARCCDVAPAEAEAAPLRMADAPPLLAALVLRAFRTPVPPPALVRPAARVPAFDDTPRRLSVVLRQ